MRAHRADWAAAPLSELALGCELLGGTDWGAVDQHAAIAAVRAAYDGGVTVFDTADVYGLGRSEEQLSAALGPRLAEVTVVTKGGIAWGEAGPDGRRATRRTLHPDHLRAAVRASLRRLRVERIPLYLAHWPDDVHAVDDVVATLAELREEGLVGAIGLSNFGIAELSRPGILQAIDAIEVEHSLIHPATDAVRLAHAQGVLPLVYGVLAQGLLTGKYAAGHAFAADDRRHRLTHFADRTAAHDQVLRRLQATADEEGLTMAQSAIRWTLASVRPGCAVVGARDPEQMAHNLAAATGEPAPGGWD